MPQYMEIRGQCWMSIPEPHHPPCLRQCPLLTAVYMGLAGLKASGDSPVFSLSSRERWDYRPTLEVLQI